MRSIWLRPKYDQKVLEQFHFRGEIDYHQPLNFSRELSGIIGMIKLENITVIILLQKVQYRNILNYILTMLIT